jgi:hypothetical protein
MIARLDPLSDPNPRNTSPLADQSVNPIAAVVICIPLPRGAERRVDTEPRLALAFY